MQSFPLAAIDGATLGMSAPAQTLPLDWSLLCRELLHQVLGPVVHSVPDEEPLRARWNQMVLLLLRPLFQQYPPPLAGRNAELAQWAAQLQTLIARRLSNMLQLLRSRTSGPSPLPPALTQRR